MGSEADLDAGAEPGAQAAARMSAYSAPYLCARASSAASSLQREAQPRNYDQQWNRTAVHPMRSLIAALHKCIHSLVASRPLPAAGVT